MPTTQKVERVAELKDRIEGSAALLLTEYRGLTVSEISELRRSLRETDTSFAVIKNTLMARAAADAGIEHLDEMLSGPSAVAFVHGDPVAAAKTLKAAAKQFPALILKGGYMDGAVFGADQANALADLESREVMLSKIAGLLKGEMSRAAAMLVQLQSRFLGVLESYKDTLPGEPAVEEPTAEAAEEPTAEAAEEPAAEAAEAEAAAEAGAEPAAEATDDEAPAEEPETTDTPEEE
jgi:large subunit ribosomal protein L10